MKKYLFILFFIASVFHLVIAYTLPTFIVANNFPYRDILYREFRIDPFTAFANFDGYQYISIAKNGYSGLQESFFPLFPCVIAFFTFFLKQYLLSGMVASSLFFFGGLFFFYKLVNLLLKDTVAKWASLFLVSFPTAFFYQMVYTESLFLFLSSAALYYLYSKKYFWAALFAVFASLTKTQGVLLVIPFIWMLSPYFQKKKLSIKHIVLSFAPLYGLAFYSGYLYMKYKDPLYFYHAQSAFHLQRSVGTFVLFPQVMYRYIKIFLTTPLNFTYAISVLEFSVFVVFLVVLSYEVMRLWRQKKRDMTQLSLQVYSLCALLFPTVTGTFVSLPRFALISLSFFIILGKIKFRILQIVLSGLFLALQAVLLVFFLKGYFVS